MCKTQSAAQNRRVWIRSYALHTVERRPEARRGRYGAPSPGPLSGADQGQGMGTHVCVGLGAGYGQAVPIRVLLRCVSGNVSRNQQRVCVGLAAVVAPAQCRPLRPRQGSHRAPTGFRMMDGHAPLFLVGVRQPLICNSIAATAIVHALFYYLHQQYAL